MRRKQPLDRMTAADSLITLLGHLDVEKFPSEERMAVAIVQIEAIDEWLAAYLEMRAVPGVTVPVRVLPEQCEI